MTAVDIISLHARVTSAVMAPEGVLSGITSCMTKAKTLVFAKLKSRRKTMR